MGALLSVVQCSIAVAFLDSVGDGSLFSGFAALEEERERRFGTNVANRRRDGRMGEEDESERGSIHTWSFSWKNFSFCSHSCLFDVSKQKDRQVHKSQQKYEFSTLFL